MDESRAVTWKKIRGNRDFLDEIWFRTIKTEKSVKFLGPKGVKNLPISVWHWPW